MTKDEENYKGRHIVIQMHYLPNKKWMAEISIDGEPRPIDRISNADEDFIRRNALLSAKSQIDNES